jgi:hypothetical protein
MLWFKGQQSTIYRSKTTRLFLVKEALTMARQPGFKAGRSSAGKSTLFSALLCLLIMLLRLVVQCTPQGPPRRQDQHVRAPGLDGSLSSPGCWTTTTPAPSPRSRSGPWATSRRRSGGARPPSRPTRVPLLRRRRARGLLMVLKPNRKLNQTIATVP